MPEPDGMDRLILTANSTHPWKVTAEIQGDELVLQMEPFEHSHPLEDITVTLIATDTFGLVETLAIAVVVEAIQTIPHPILRAVNMIENQDPLHIHVTTAEDILGDFAFVDEDSYSNFNGDSLRFEVQTSEPDLLHVMMLTQAAEQHCVFPFSFQGVVYHNCTSAGTGLLGPRGYKARFSWCSINSTEIVDVNASLHEGKVGKCKHVLQGMNSQKMYLTTIFVINNNL
jgi:hypothetical protein